MSIVNTATYFLMISQVLLYIVQAGSFLIKPFNKPQKYFNQLFVKSWFYNQLKIGYLVLICLLAVLFAETLSMWKWDKQLISQHLDQTSLDAIEDREDLYRNERNMYVYGAAFFLSCANLRYMIHLNDYYGNDDQVKFLTKEKKVL